MPYWYSRFWGYAFLFRRVEMVALVLGCIALAACAVWRSWEELGPHKPVLSASRRQLVDEALPGMLEDLRNARQEVRSVAMLHFAGDPSDYVSDRIRTELEHSGILDLRDRSFGEKLRKKLNFRIEGVQDVDAAMEACRGNEVQGVLFGNVEALESHPGGARLEMRVSLARAVDGELLLDRRYSREISASPLNAGVIADAVAGHHPARRLLIWGLVVLLLPVFSMGFIRAMVRKGSNRANGVTLSIYTLADTLLAYLILGGALDSWVSVLLFLLLIGVAFAYDVFLMTLALKLES